jgi:hypothetical protein
MDIKNFPTVGFTKTIGVEKQSKNKWKILQIYCLGTLVCDVENCQWVGLPPTGSKMIEKYIAK